MKKSDESALDKSLYSFSLYNIANSDRLLSSISERINECLEKIESGNLNAAESAKNNKELRGLLRKRTEFKTLKAFLNGVAKGKSYDESLKRAVGS